MTSVDTSIEMWLTLILIGITIAAYASERLPVELTAVGALGALLLMFHLTALLRGGEPVLGLDELLQGFASPALIAVSALLVIGQAMTNSGALEGIARGLITVSGTSYRRALGFSLGGVTGLSGFLNNTPVVIIFLPILRAIADRFGRPAGKVMMPLSFAAILGGMITLIGSSSNLLVSAELAKNGLSPFKFFDFTVPGLVLACAGMGYVLLLPRLLPRRDQPPDLIGADGKQFIAELNITPDSPLITETSRGGLFAGLPEVTVRLQRQALERRQKGALAPPHEADRDLR